MSGSVKPADRWEHALDGKESTFSQMREQISDETNDIRLDGALVHGSSR